MTEYVSPKIMNNISFYVPILIQHSLGKWKSHEKKEIQKEKKKLYL